MDALILFAIRYVGAVTRSRPTAGRAGRGSGGGQAGVRLTMPDTLRNVSGRDVPGLSSQN
ncbi:hypothetical protein Acy02nite_01610 [Actinoplanes cyaneus]|uniref:Uncharacterized protein n=1 Tax=Actinoplanes cyaneus TaxID=52696 RepID=A0A919IA46_9ACTN|nr:hypothetical protein Acy02nite_01610 [Actinoplanes cyaneus]